MRGVNRIEYVPDVIEAKHGGQALLPFGMDKLQGVPLTFKYVDKEEFDAAITDAHRGGRPFIDVFTVQEIVLQFQFVDQIGSFAVEIDEHTHKSSVALLGAYAHTGPIERDLRYASKRFKGSLMDFW